MESVDSSVRQRETCGERRTTSGFSPVGWGKEGRADAPLRAGALEVAEAAGGAVGEEGGGKGVGADTAVLGGARLEEAEQLLCGESGSVRG